MMASPIRKAEQVAPLVRGVLQRKCACGARASGGGTCGQCGGLRAEPQKTLIIGASSDPLEREADQVAEQVLADRIQSDFGRIPLSIQRHTPTEAQQFVDAPPSVDRALAMPGRPLDAPLRGDMETRFGHDFSQVRVHEGAAAEQSARDVAAQAYTVGSHIVFGARHFARDMASGGRLLAHELAHVIQQDHPGEATGHNLRLTGQGDPSEREAHRASEAIVSGGRFLPQVRTGPTLARLIGGDGAEAESHDAQQLTSAPAPASTSEPADLPAVTFGAIAFRGSANRIAPTQSVDVAVTLNGVPPGEAVSIDVEGLDPANGMTSIVAGSSLTSSGTVTVKARSQTMPGNAGALKLRATYAGSLLAQSDGFTVAAYPINFSSAFFDDITNADVVGFEVQDEWESDGSGPVAELGEVKISERVDIQRTDVPFKSKGNLTSSYERAYELSHDLHTYPKSKIDVAGLGFGTWELVFGQLSLFKCARTGVTDVVMPNSGFTITHTVSHLSPMTSPVHRMTKVGAAVTVEGRTATAGVANIVSGDHLL